MSERKRIPEGNALDSVLLSAAKLYATLPPELGGDALDSTTSLGAAERSRKGSLSVSSLLPQFPGAAPLRDEVLHERVRNRTLLLDKERSGDRSSRHAQPLGSDLRRLPGAALVFRKAMKRARSSKVVIPKKEQRYNIYVPLANLWRDYARNVVEGNGDINTIGERIIRMDMHGAEIHVVRAKDPGLVGLCGILILETANTVQIITRKNRLVTVPKSSAVIEIRVDNRLFEIALPMLPYRASERSARKLKKKHMQVF